MTDQPVDDVLPAAYVFGGFGGWGGQDPMLEMYAAMARTRAGLSPRAQLEAQSPRLTQDIDESSVPQKRRHAGGRPTMTEEERAEKRRLLLGEVLPIAEELWRDVDGGPTLELAAGAMGISGRGLEKRFREARLSWTKTKDIARQQVFGGFRAGLVA